MNWDFPDPFTLDLEVGDADIDELGHVNNAVYVRWLEQVSWAHSGALGLGLDVYRARQRAMVVRRHELDYLAPALQGQHLVIATWLLPLSNRLSVQRRFQIMRPGDGTTLLRGLTTFVCVDTVSGRARRLPDEYRAIYSAAACSAARDETL